MKNVYFSRFWKFCPLNKWIYMGTIPVMAKEKVPTLADIYFYPEINEVGIKFGPDRMDWKTLNVDKAYQGNNEIASIELDAVNYVLEKGLKKGEPICVDDGVVLKWGGDIKIRISTKLSPINFVDEFKDELLFSRIFNPGKFDPKKIEEIYLKNKFHSVEELYIRYVFNYGQVPYNKFKIVIENLSNLETACT